MPFASVTVVPLLEPRVDPLLAVEPVVRPELEPEEAVDDEPETLGDDEAPALEPGVALEPVPAALPVEADDPLERLEVVLAPEGFSAVIVSVMPGWTVNVRESPDALALLDALDPAGELDEAVDPPEVEEPEPEIPEAPPDAELPARLPLAPPDAEPPPSAPLAPIAPESTILHGALPDALIELEPPAGELLV
ncbi:MAG: hypothetical protein ACK4MV_14310 [Beijerinckiaceae bacterium]